MLYLGKSRIDLATFSLNILNHDNATHLPVSYLENKSLCFSGKVRAMKHFAGLLYDYTVFWKLKIFKVTSCVLLLAFVSISP